MPRPMPRLPPVTSATGREPEEVMVSCLRKSATGRKAPAGGLILSFAGAGCYTKVIPPQPSTMRFPMNVIASRAWLAILTALAISFAAQSAAAQDQPDRAAAAQRLEQTKAQYTKYEYRIPMRDGKKLFTAVYVPKDIDQRYPIMMTRTPYSVGPYGTDQYKADLGPSPHFSKSGYIFVYQDVRGRWLSEGEFVNMRPHLPDKQPTDIDESTDTYDTIDWLLKHVPGHNCRVGLWGISYPGFYAAAGMIDAHPALKAASPQAPVIDWFVGDDWHHNGAFFLPHAFVFLASFDHPRPRPTSKFRFEFDPGTPDGY